MDFPSNILIFHSYVRIPGGYLKKLMLEGVPHQVAKVVSISTNPQKAKTCHGVTSHVGPRFEKTRLSTMSGIKLTHISSLLHLCWSNPWFRLLPLSPPGTEVPIGALPCHKSPQQEDHDLRPQKDTGPGDQRQIMEDTLW